ncbi:MAG: hypothetical protein ACR2GY_08165 [Phycisphaerales bacterium]
MKRSERFIVCLQLLVSMLAPLIVSGCGGNSYAIEGRVVRGELPYITLVAADDPALELGEGIDGARITLIRDPNQLNRTAAASTRSRDGGWFVLDVQSFGAGWMDEEWEVQAASGSRAAQTVLRLPARPGGKVLLVILAPGALPSDENLMGEVERYR